MRWVGQC
ncbi:hypothetical protein VHUM_00421 [Vanrija humicola]|nr:hypothetical protein VHUM_00421 [Vanrija humicola]